MPFETMSKCELAYKSGLGQLYATLQPNSYHSSNKGCQTIRQDVLVACHKLKCLVILIERTDKSLIEQIH